MELQKENEILKDKYEREMRTIKERYEHDMQVIREETDQKFSHIITLIQQNPKLANIKHEALAKKVKY